METISPGLAGQRGLRGEVLLEIKKSQPLTARQLADRFAVSTTAIRRHLKELEAEGLIAYAREQRGHGAPTYAYRLSDDGEALFPRQYEAALTRLLRHVMEREGKETAVSLLQEQYLDLQRQLGSDFAQLGVADRVRAMATALEKAGFMAECEEDGGVLQLTIHNCAIHAAASCLPEVCETEVDFLRGLLDVPIERTDHIMNGCNACRYVVKNESVGLS